MAEGGTRQRRRDAKKALPGTKKVYQSLYDDTPVMMHSIDHKGRLVSVNHYWLEVMGYELDEVIGRPSTDFLTKEAARRALEVHLPSFFETGSAKDVEYQMVKKSGEVIDVLLSATAQRDRGESIGYSLAFMVDVTERKRLHEREREGGAPCERDSLVKEIHDAVAQSLSGIAKQLEETEESLSLQLQALATAHDSENLSGPGTSNQLSRRPNGEMLEALTERELDVLEQLASGASNKEIASCLSLSVRTVKFHLESIYRKLGVRSRAHAVRRAIDYCLVSV